MVAATADEIDYGAKLGDVRASIRPNLEVSRHVFTGKTTYVVRDPVTAQTHRFTAEDYQLLVSIDQSRTLKESLNGLIEKKRLDSSMESNFYKFVIHLHQMGLLSLPLSDGASLHKRYKQRVDAQSKGRFMKLLFMKVPLVKPDKFLNDTQNFAAPLFTLTAAWIWLACVCVSLVILATHWSEFVNPLGTMLTLSNVPNPLVPVGRPESLPRDGHAYACKIFGGKVPEMGAMIMMGTPCAYVDASSSWSFPNRWHRMLVALAGCISSRSWQCSR